MTLHIFNPEHDIALGAGSPFFTAPHAGRQMRADLCWIPAIWAEEGDAVAVADDDREKYDRKLARVLKPRRKSIRWVTEKELASLDVDCVEPWGWDVSVAHWLERKGISKSLMPNAEELEAIRQLSARQTARDVLASTKNEFGDCVCGEVSECRSMTDVEAFMAAHPSCVIKSPWSSSGRGVRFLQGEPDVPLHGWIKRTIEQQGAVMMERKEPKVQDFAMEFHCDGNGKAEYRGLSLFSTSGSAYTGNLLMDEDEKTALLGQWIDVQLLYNVRDFLTVTLANLCDGKYAGPLGVDMMIVAGHDRREGFLLQPCVEINLRHTMGMAALCLAHLNGRGRMMQVTYDGSYHLSVKNYKTTE